MTQDATLMGSNVLPGRTKPFAAAFGHVFSSLKPCNEMHCKNWRSRVTIGLEKIAPEGEVQVLSVYEIL